LDVASNSTATVRVLIQTKGQPSAAHDNAIAGARGSKRAGYASVNTVVADVPANQVASLALRSDVEYVSPDRPVKGEASLLNETIGAAQVQDGAKGASGLTGKGIGIAILDSGISASHPDFAGKNKKSRVVASVDFTGSATKGDADGHGTGVAGVAAGSGAASNGYGANYAGVASGADLIDVRVLDEHGAGRTSNVLAGLNWAIENSKKFNIRVINMSLGAPVRESFHTDPLCKAVEHAVNSGIVVVTSAGNMGRTEEIVGHNADGSPIYQLAYGIVSSPGNSPYAITVGATDTHNTAKRSDDTVACVYLNG
jgi:serine protease AprX